MIIIVIYHKKSKVQPAEVAIMAQRQDKLLEESEAVRPEEEGFHGVGNSVKMSNDYEQSNPWFFCLKSQPTSATLITYISNKVNTTYIIKLNYFIHVIIYK